MAEINLPFVNNNVEEVTEVVVCCIDSNRKKYPFVHRTYL
jgi:hypothetical protein